ncbi:hypothetical protein CYMTET_17402 [Cymbomonas tetramitiformis]|uniref:Uncharacterized protein n=1 Tax=Cymbomonas tetramitiformis TaxID=36881 RepID=A0AAE0GAL3_9CHLO|nr:hypothetical protein CYMTET_17402 [Cymbomonas tetramitiformis]
MSDRHGNLEIQRNFGQGGGPKRVVLAMDKEQRRPAKSRLSGRAKHRAPSEEDLSLDWGDGGCDDDDDMPRAKIYNPKTGKYEYEDEGPEEPIPQPVPTRNPPSAATRSASTKESSQENDSDDCAPRYFNPKTGKYETEDGTPVSEPCRNPPSSSARGSSGRAGLTSRVDSSHGASSSELEQASCRVYDPKTGKYEVSSPQQPSSGDQAIRPPPGLAGRSEHDQQGLRIESGGRGKAKGGGRGELYRPPSAGKGGAAATGKGGAAAMGKGGAAVTGKGGAAVTGKGKGAATGKGKGNAAAGASKEDVQAVREEAERAEERAEQMRLQVEALLMERTKMKAENNNLTREKQFLEEQLLYAEMSATAGDHTQEHLLYADAHLEEAPADDEVFGSKDIGCWADVEEEDRS